MAEKNLFTHVVKRDGRVVPFEQSRITNAIYKAMRATKEGNLAHDPIRVSDWVVKELKRLYSSTHKPRIEEIQDVVEEVLVIRDFPKTVKAYILYRSERTRVREQGKLVPEQVQKLVQESKKYFKDALAEFVYYRTYSRWIEKEDRRETWVETVDRYMAFMRENLGPRLKEAEYQLVRDAILHQNVMPSMRLFWGAGKAARATSVCAYNCSYVAPTKIRDFAEIMYLLMCGTGVGFSVESQTVQQLPIVKRQISQELKTHRVEDSKEGWGDALTLGMEAWYGGKDVRFDYSKLRPAGARLYTMGGRSAGPEPLRALLDFTRSKILTRQGKRLSNIDIHDIICKIGEVIVAGGVRRCLPHHTLVHTKDGLKQIKDIRSGDEVLTAKGVYRNVVASQYTGKRKLLAIHTQLGIFQSTPEHRWAVLDDLDGNVRWVEACNLTQNDTLIHIPEVIPGKKTSLPAYKYKKPKHSTTTQDITIPQLDKDIVWLIGYLHGDGYIYRKDATYGEIMFACSPDMPETAKRVKENLERFNVRPKIVVYHHDRSIRIRVKSNQLANYFYQFKQPNSSIVIPDFILQGTPEIRAAYIAGAFDADGSIKSRNGKKVRPIITSSIYPDWLRQLRAVLASLGISALVKQNRPARENWKALYLLTTISIEAIIRFSEQVGVYSEKWRNDAVHLGKKKEQNSFVVPRNVLAQSPYRKAFDSAYYVSSSNVALSLSKFERIVGQLHESSSVKDNRVAVLEKEPTVRFPIVFSYLPNKCVMLQRGYKPVKIKRITKGGSDHTYDIQVEGDEQFVAEGMLVHNSALISLSDLDDEKMRQAKMGQFYLTDPQRSMANNSAVYLEKPTATQFLEEWISLAKGGTGERGIFNRGGLQYQMPKRRWAISQKSLQTMGTNPCGEILLRSKSFCNLTEVVCRAEDTEETLLEKIEIATLLGTYQATLTRFPYLSKEWKKNCNEERLLGVSLTGQWDCPAVRNSHVLANLRQRAVAVNRKYAKRFGINRATSITCVKPSGTVSQMTDTASGMHPRQYQYYIRRVRISAADPLFHMLKDQKFPYYPEVGQLEHSATTYVLEFPVKAPEGAIFKNDLKAADQLEHWKMVKEHFTEHNPSVTISIGADEWIATANWLYEHWNILGGLAFLPRSDTVYKLAPYEEIGEKRYKELAAKLPEIDFAQIVVYEKEDETIGSKELACVGGVCELSSEEMAAVSAAKSNGNNNSSS